MERDNSRFPAASYKEVVLEPLFESFKEHFYQELMAINYAHTVMLAEQNIITVGEAKEIIQGLHEIDEEIDLISLKYTGEFEDVYFYVEQELIKKIGIEIAGKMHTGRSRNDMGVTMYKMKVKHYLSSLINQLIKLIDSLIKVAEENKAAIVIAYTHGQPAQPTTFGHYLGALIEILERDLDLLFHVYRVVDKSSMGAAAITTSGFNLNRERMAELLGFSEAQENSYGCIAAIDYLTEVYSTLKILFINLGRFIQDLEQWTSFDLSYLYVPNEFVQISSIMPQKRNPVPIEHMRILSSMTIGYCDTVINSMHNTPFTDINDAEDPIQVVGFKAFLTSEGVLKLLADFVLGLKVNKERIEERIGETYVSITELADSLVREKGISFRQAHGISSRLVKALIQKKNSLGDIKYELFRSSFIETMQREPKITEAKLRKFVDPEYFISVREQLGGPGPQALSRSLSNYKDKLVNYQKKNKKIKEFEEVATNKLNRIIREYI